MNDYQNLYTLADGTTGVQLIIPMAGARMGGGRSSGHVPEGRFAILIESVESKGKSDKAKTPGVSFVFGQKTAAPAGFEGVDIVTYAPQPQHFEVEHDKDLQRWQKMVLSMLSGFNPALYKQCVETGQTLNISTDDFVGKYLFVYVKDGKGQYSDRSEIAYYITKEEYEKAPGPVRKLPTAAGMQATTPEIGIVGAGAVSTPVAMAAPVAAVNPVAAAVGQPGVVTVQQPAFQPAPVAAAPIATAPVTSGFAPANGGPAAAGAIPAPQSVASVKHAIGIS